MVDNGVENDDGDFVSRIVLSDETNIHLSGKVNCHNVRIWGTEQGQPHEIEQHERDSPEVDVVCAIARNKV